MKDINKMGKGEFENRWKQAFEGSEIRPSDNLWVGIEAAIANDEAARYRRGMAYYKWIAAAILLLALSVGGYMGYRYQSSDSVQGTITQTEQIEAVQSQDPENPIVPDNTESLSSPESGQQVASSNDLTRAPDRQTNSSHQEAIDRSSTNSGQALYVSATKDTENAEIDRYFNKPNTPTTGLASTSILTSREISVSETPAPLLPEKVYGVPVYPVIRKEQRSNLWAGISVMPGYFNPNYQGQNNLQANYNSLRSVAQSNAGEEHSAGLSMSFGFDMGLKLSERWQLSSGLQYLNNQVQSTTDLVLNNRTPVFSSVIESLDLSESSADISYEPTDLNSTFQFISIPVQAGYLVFDNKVKLMVQAGVASDFFIKNEITAKDQSLESVTIDSGSDAPFRSMYLNGLIGAQASYEVLPRYLITLEPRYKLALSDFTKPESGYSSVPSSFGVGVGIRYVFK